MRRELLLKPTDICESNELSSISVHALFEQAVNVFFWQENWNEKKQQIAEQVVAFPPPFMVDRIWLEQK